MGRQQAILLSSALLAKPSGGATRPENVILQIMPYLASPEFFAGSPISSINRRLDFQANGGVQAILSIFDPEGNPAREVLRLGCAAMEFMPSKVLNLLDPIYFRNLCQRDTGRVNDDALVIASMRLLIKLAPTENDPDFNAELVERYASVDALKIYSCQAQTRRYPSGRSLGHARACKYKSSNCWNPESVLATGSV